MRAGAAQQPLFLGEGAAGRRHARLWRDVEFYAQGGTASSPIVLKAETPGGVIFTGSSEMNIYGSYLIIDGFYWNGGTGTSDHVEFRKSGSQSQFGTNCTIRNCAFDDLQTPEPSKSRWIVLHGTNNVVENCSFVITSICPKRNVPLPWISY